MNVNDPGTQTLETPTTTTAPPPATKAKVRKPKAAKVKKAKSVRKGKVKAHKPVKGNIFDPMYRQQYKIHKDHKAPGGGARITCNDEVAKFLLDKTDADLEKLAHRIGVVDRWNNWLDLNTGMRRMNFGNVLRGMVNRGEFILKDGNLSKGEGKAKVKKAKATTK